MESVNHKDLYFDTSKKYISKIEQLSREQKNNLLSFIKRIFYNIKKNPNSLAFQNLNILKIKKFTKKWDNIPMMIFLSAGFVEDSNKQKKITLCQKQKDQFDKVSIFFFKIINLWNNSDDANRKLTTSTKLNKIKIWQPRYSSSDKMKNNRVEKVLKIKSTINNQADTKMAIKQEYFYEIARNELADLHDDKKKQLIKRRELFRIKKQKIESQKKIQQIKEERQATKTKIELKEKWEDYQAKLLVIRKKNEKMLNIKRKAKAREIIKKHKEERKCIKKYNN